MQDGHSNLISVTNSGSCCYLSTARLGVDLKMEKNSYAATFPEAKCVVIALDPNIRVRRPNINMDNI